MEYIVQIDEESIILESSDRKRRFYNGETTNYNIYVRLYPEYFRDFKSTSSTNPYNYSIENDVSVVTGYTGYNLPNSELGKDGDIYKLIGSNYVYDYTNHSISLLSKDNKPSYIEGENIGYMIPKGGIKSFILENGLININFDDNMSKENKYINISGKEYKLGTSSNSFIIDDLEVYNSILDRFESNEYIYVTLVDREYRTNRNYIKRDGVWVLSNTSTDTNLVITDIGGDVIDLD